MSSRKTPPQEAIQHAAARRRAEREILDGRLPRLDELLRGSPFRSGNLVIDMTTWAKTLLAEPEMLDGELRDVIHLISISTSPGLLVSAIEQLKRVEAETSATDPDLGRQLDDGVWRCRLYLCALGKGGRQDLIHNLIVRPAGSYTEGEYRAFAHGLMCRKYFMGFEHPGEVLREGQNALNRLAAQVNQLDRAMDILDAPIEEELDPTHPDDDALSDAMMALAEDRAEVIRAAVRPQHVAVVVPAAPANATGARREIWRSFETIAGRALPLIDRGDPIAHQISLQLRFPHAAAAISKLLRDLPASPAAWIRPTLLIGSPGCGKTSLAWAVAETIGLPAVIYNAGGIADSSGMGTSAQWHSARPSVALDLVRSCAKANPLVVLDELDKIDTDRRNGSLADGLLGFLERGTAARYRDLALEVECDLSHVCWIATANRLEDVPAPLRDRMRVVQVPDPTWAHVGDLSRRILDEIASDRGLDERWIDDLAADELEILKSAWPGGSLRRLRRALEVMIDGRDRLMGRA
ncbi:hypothetical protein GCM10008171_01770 [Methylopila jiangsuensis]|uniref:AAA+ ATPase domain-containing protein n=1 Tax=Methylopila jiangsuensis TaxID=586230 RepID=A0A9W6JF79_9HYPH|nr:AAA family ATPase [Methylopila jiangsuensis]MDR6287343.1 hypothetical protein [Methylopila jiangsuensis]GLK74924.1 hypothetical protein GCM10008171_01770 [Methylopila jiangsuensis]